MLLDYYRRGVKSIGHWFTDGVLERLNHADLINRFGPIPSEVKRDVERLGRDAITSVSTYVPTEAAAMPSISYKQQSRVRADCNWLNGYARNVASQDGQDGVLEKIFEVIKPVSKIAVEFGGFDGKTMSNTWRLIAEEGWSGILAEANVERCKQIKINHPYERVTALNHFITWNGENSFDNVINRLKLKAEIDLLSIDIDGNDWHVWNGIHGHKPRVINIEFNPTVPNDVYFVQAANPSINQGSSLSAMIKLGKEKGYSLVCIAGMDAFFVLDELYSLFNIPDNSIDSMFNPSQTLIFQGYDGTFFTAGMRTLSWKNRPFAFDEIQLLEKRERFFGDRQAS